MNLLQRIESLEARAAVAYESLHAALAASLKSADETKRCKLELARAKQQLLTNNPGKALGTNEETRKAAIADMTKHRQIDLDSAEEDERQALNRLELAKVEVEDVRFQLRVMELYAGLREMALDQKEVMA